LKTVERLVSEGSERSAAIAEVFGNQRNAEQLGPSGNHDTRVKASVKHRAEYLSQRDVGSVENWEDYIEEAKGYVSKDDSKKWMEGRGFTLVESYPYHNPERQLLFEMQRYEYKLLKSKK
jgi:hypothetical protein